MEQTVVVKGVAELGDEDLALAGAELLAFGRRWAAGGGHLAIAETCWKHGTAVLEFMSRRRGDQLEEGELPAYRVDLGDVDLVELVRCRDALEEVAAAVAGVELEEGAVLDPAAQGALWRMAKAPLEAELALRTATVEEVRQLAAQVVLH